MINLIRKDILVSYSNKGSIAYFLFAVPFILFVLGAEEPNKIFMFVVASFVYIMTKIPFSYEIKDKPHIFIQSLPIKKKDIVIAKYISIFINFGVGVIYTFVYMWIMSLIGLVDVDKIKVINVLLTLGFTIVTLSISMPMQFRFTPKVANYLNMFFYIGIMNLIVLDGNLIAKILGLDLSNIYTRLVIVSGILVLYLTSMSISIGLYNSRKFY